MEDHAQRSGECAHSDIRAALTEDVEAFVRRSLALDIYDQDQLIEIDRAFASINRIEVVESSPSPTEDGQGGCETSEEEDEEEEGPGKAVQAKQTASKVSGVRCRGRTAPD